MRGLRNHSFSYHHHNHPERVEVLSLPIFDGRIAQSASHGLSLPKLDLTNVIVVVFVIVDVVTGEDGTGTTIDSCAPTGCISRTELDSGL